MKNLTPFVIVYFIISGLYSQNNEVWTHIPHNHKAFLGDDVYIIQNKDLVKIENISTSMTPNNSTVFVADLPDTGSYHEMLFYQSDLYILSFDNNINKILKIDVNSINPQPIEVVNSSNTGNSWNDIAINDTELYIRQRLYAPLGQKIHKLNLLNPDEGLTTIIDEITDFTYFSLTAQNDKLYFTFSGKIFYIDLINDVTFSNPVSYYFDGFYSNYITFDNSNNHLFATDSGMPDAGLIILDVSTDPPNNLYTGWDEFVIHQNQIYVHNGYIYYYSFRKPIPTTSLELTENQNEVKLEIYPNPATDYIKIKNQLKQINYEIFNVIGRKISEGSSYVESIDINALPIGLYFLKVKDKIYKFIKK